MGTLNHMRSLTDLLVVHNGNDDDECCYGYLISIQSFVDVG